MPPSANDDVTYIGPYKLPDPYGGALIAGERYMNMATDPSVAGLTFDVPYYANTIKPHRQGLNVLIVDGHVEWRGPFAYGYDYWASGDDAMKGWLNH